MLEVNSAQVTTYADGRPDEIYAYADFLPKKGKTTVPKSFSFKRKRYEVFSIQTISNEPSGLIHLALKGRRVQRKVSPVLKVPRITFKLNKGETDALYHLLNAEKADVRVLDMLKTKLTREFYRK